MSRSASTEDADSARCLEISGEPGAVITSIVVNEEMGHVWTGRLLKIFHDMALFIIAQKALRECQV